ncbi:MAG TPA: TetR/AcrR family transcriptional regulator [Ilumatobacteraceae bacterium]|nr:TetR/AcrR family transcriptional regulator [Ilumatobacteraceae bacterium]HRB05554.1 TetR/AcrR family transcriptional regulator [Ilumatobacteraceae bacterium]
MTGLQEPPRAPTKGERTRERLLKVAVARFGTHGYRATSVSQLSRDAGLTPAAAYAYFDDKETFWRSAIDTDLNSMRIEVVASSASGERPIVDYMFALVEGLRGHALARRVLVEGTPNDLQQVVTHPLFAATTRLVAEALARRQAAGVLPADAKPEQLALAMETVSFALVLAVVRAGMEGMGERVASVVELMEAAMGGPPTASERLR